MVMLMTLQLSLNFKKAGSMQYSLDVTDVVDLLSLASLFMLTSFASVVER